MQTESSKQAADPDRLILKEFSLGGGNHAKVELVNKNEEPGCATYCLWEEDHTLGNLLRHMIMKDPRVEYCGYTAPHPSEAKIHLRIQTADGTEPAVIMQDAIDHIIEQSTFILSQFDQEYKKLVDSLPIDE